MTKSITMIAVVTAVLLLSGMIATVGLSQQAYAVKATGTHASPSNSYGKKNAGKICGDQLCSQYPGGYEAYKNGQPGSQKETSTEKPAPKATTPTPKPKTDSMKQTQKQEQKMTQSHTWTTLTKTVTSVQDPGQGHESHQLAIILPPTGKIYKGILSYDASEPIQLVALHGPLAEGEDQGQAIWTPDGKTKFALTFVDPQNAMGTWTFTGDALAVHTKNTAPFTVSYTISYMEMDASDTTMSGTITSVQDPGQGHESHQLAVILPPNGNTYTGVLTYDASEPIQLVALHGPLAEGEDQGQAIWTPDGKTKFALTFVDPQNAMGTWTFSGNALAVHTKNTTPFAVSYTVVSSKN